MPAVVGVRPEITVAVASPLDTPAVEAFVHAHPHASVYHLPAFARVIRRGGGLEVATFVARRAASGPIAGILPVALTRSLLFGRYATSLPYFNYGGILAAGGDPAVSSALADAAWRWAAARGARSMVLRHTEERPLALPATAGKETLTLALPESGDPAELFQAIGSKTRNLVRKGEKAGLVARVEEGEDALRAFHQVLSENMRDLGSPAHGARFYRILLEEAGPRARLHVVRTAGGEAAAAALTIAWRDGVEVPWASCRRRFNGVAANMTLYWHLLEDATRAGARLFDFGRSTPGSGPYRFKLQWGARPHPLPWYYVAPDGGAPTRDLAPTNPKYARAIRVWQRLPVPVTRFIGARLAPVLP